MTSISEIVNRNHFSKADIMRLLSINAQTVQDALFQQAEAVKEKTVGKKVFLRGLIEFSNLCQKNCFYCGIRSGNANVTRYSMTDKEILQQCEEAGKHHFTGIVLQSGEQRNRHFTDRLTRLITNIKKTIQPELRITLSVGEQSLDTYRQWFEAGAERYLLRIETSSEELYRKIHPIDALHSFKNRLQCLENIQKIGYQTGTGVMIGLPFQTIENLADDLLFIKQMNIDMVGMGPYLEHAETPFFKYKETLLPLKERFNLSLRMLAVLRLMMPDINMVATTALQAIQTNGREMGLKAGANVLMPNITPSKYRSSYLLYDNKPSVNEDAEETIQTLTENIKQMGETIVFDNYGDSIHFTKRKIESQQPI
ncbi:MAG: [FeFe] hydrogenase H-cluster radical SAM maturase HydE [Microbacter sp.]